MAKIVNPIDIAVIKNVLFPAWKRLVADRRKFDEVTFAAVRQKGETELERLKAAAAKGWQALEKALSGYKWVAEQIDTIRRPWVIAALKQDDCDGSMILINEVLPGGRMWLLCHLENGQIKDFQKWHWIYEDATGCIWSNFGTSGASSPEAFAKKYNKKFNYIVEARDDFSAVGEIRAI